MISKRLSLIGIGVLGIVLLGGCAGKAEVEELGYVMGVGVDLGKKPGYYAVTYQVVIPQGGKDGGGENKPWTITVEATSLREARSYVNEIFDREVFMGTTRVFIIGEEAAKEGLNPIIETVQRFYEYRRTLYLVLAQGKAADLLNLQLKSEAPVALNINTLIEQSGLNARAPVTRLGHYLTVIGTEGKEPLLPVIQGVSPDDERIQYQSESGEIENIWMKTAGAFHGDKLELLLSEQETLGALYFLNEVKKKVIAVNAEDRDLLYAGLATGVSVKSKLITKDGQVGVNYKIDLQVDLEEIRDKDFKSDKDMPELVARAKGLIEDSVRRDCEAALKKARETQLDFLGIGRTIQMKDPKLWQELKGDWEKRLPEIPIEIEVNVKIRHTGTSFQSPGTNR